MTVVIVMIPSDVMMLVELMVCTECVFANYNNTIAHPM